MTAKKWTRLACRINLLIGYKTEAIATDHWARMRFEPPARPRRPIWQLGGTRKGSLIDNSDTSKQSIKCYLFLTTIRWNVYNNLTNTNISFQKSMQQLWQIHVYNTTNSTIVTHPNNQSNANYPSATDGVAAISSLYSGLFRELIHIIYVRQDLFFIWLSTLGWGILVKYPVWVNLYRLLGWSRAINESWGAKDDAKFP